MRPVPLAARLAVVGTALAAAVAATVSGSSAAPAPAPDRALDRAATAPAKPLAGLKVLMTNDDSAQGRDAGFGTDGKGLYELRRALCSAGADVLVVAPWSQQSGAGARMTPPGFNPVSFTVQAVTPPAAYAGDCATGSTGGAVFGVCIAAAPCASGTPTASPADTVNVALSRFAATYWSGGPDLVVSGTNFGQNIGATLNHSGTVGAAVTAHEYGVPAIAFSAEVPRDLAQIPNVPFAATADFGVRLITALRQRRALDRGLVLNVNHPFVGAGEKLGRPVLTDVGVSSDLGLTFLDEVPRTGGTYRLVPGAPATETRRNADTTALAQNKIPISSLDGDWGRTTGRGKVAGVIAQLR
ncbi:5'/3'-nucleotidase SurE [Pimelobacter simplex]|uniref:5'/3'-nucleotidase SurE n=1 Tax=Nocardioides simplex TaxID=2045 RepID=UPI0021501BBC|nr:5'/3'-nucleotidase SurE [Pimelobacter simplex]UUW89438.1 5'/3'-nucleotidase SurE [Pimelobacter simplex]UUW93267.1 5'/3'-nucleotidase SurE [Pimelobacter simplex]